MNRDRASRTHFYFWVLILLGCLVGFWKTFRLGDSAGLYPTRTTMDCDIPQKRFMLQVPGAGATCGNWVTATSPASILIAFSSFTNSCPACFETLSYWFSKTSTPEKKDSVSPTSFWSPNAYVSHPAPECPRAYERIVTNPDSSKVRGPQVMIENCVAENGLSALTKADLFAITESARGPSRSVSSSTWPNLENAEFNSIPRFLASVSTPLKSFSVSSADFFADPACWVTNASNWSDFDLSSPFFVRSWISYPLTSTFIDAIWIPVASSPRIPPATNKTLMYSKVTFQTDGLFTRSTPNANFSAQISTSSRWSCQMTTNSMRTPIATAAVQTHPQCSIDGKDLVRLSTLLSKADMQLSKAEMDLSRAEESVGRIEAAWCRSAIVAIIGLSCALLFGVRLIILAVWDQHVYNRNKANRL